MSQIRIFRKLTASHCNREFRFKDAFTAACVVRVYFCDHCCAGNFFSTMTPLDTGSFFSRLMRFTLPRTACNCLEVILADNNAMPCLEASCPLDAARAYQEYAIT